MKMPFSISRDFVIAILGAIIAIGSTIAWDTYKIHKEVSSKDAAIIWILREEILEDLQIIGSNNTLLKRELPILKKHQFVITALRPFQTASWDMLKANLPETVSADQKLLNQLRAIFSHMADMNETIRSRESFRMLAQASNGFADAMEHFDKILLESHVRLTTDLKEIVLP